MTLIGLDVGTTGCKAIVFDPGGNVLGRAFPRIRRGTCDAPAKAEQDAEQVWSLDQGGAARSLQPSPPPKISRALACRCRAMPSSRWTRISARCIRRSWAWTIARSAQAERCARSCGAFALFQRTGMRPHPMNSLTKVLWLRELAPSVFDRAAKIRDLRGFYAGEIGRRSCH